MPEPILSVRGLTKHYGGGRSWLRRGRAAPVNAVDDVDFSIERGETFALVGESGCGKSTIARCVAGLVAPTRGSVTFSGRRLQMIFQDPYSSLNARWRVFDLIAEPIRAYRLINDSAALRRRIDALLEQVGLISADGRKFAHEFSGGQRQRISIARALASEPDFLICDEPTSALDVSVQAQILNLMKDLQRDLGLTLLFISHNLAVVYQMADRVGVMYLGKMVETADIDDLYTAPRHPYTRMLLAAIPRLDGANRPRVIPAGEPVDGAATTGGCRFRPRCALAFDRCGQDEPALRDGVACHAAENAPRH